MQPFVFVTSVQDFDVELLPQHARAVGSPEFQKAITERIERDFAPFADRVEVGVTSTTITVTVWPREEGIDPVEVGISQLQSGDLARGAQTLEAMAAVQPMNPSILFNLGMAKSDLGETADAIRYLARFLTIVPGDAAALTALGLAYYRSGDLNNALEIMQKAVNADPANGYAVRNLGGILAAQGRKDEAAPHLIEAARLLPDDVRALYGASQALQERGDDDSVKLADSHLERIISLDPRSDIAEEARSQRSRIAQASMRATVGGGLRPDAMMYILGALEKFRNMTPQQIQQVAFEAAMTGQSGLDVNSSEQKYTLQSLPGKYSGLHMVSIMYAAVKQVDPTADIGFDLAREYEAAQAMLRPQ